MTSCVQRKGVVSSQPTARPNFRRLGATFRPKSIATTTRRPVACARRRWRNLSDFAVGFSRQPLPKGNRFAIVTNADGPGIMATDATTRHGLDLTTLRPETIESLKAKLPPTANFHNPVGVIGGGVIPFLTPHSTIDTAVLTEADGLLQTVGELVASEISTAEDARAGFRKITNGVKQRASGTRPLGVEANQVTPHGVKAAFHVIQFSVRGKGDGAHAADVRIVLMSSRFP